VPLGRRKTDVAIISMDLLSSGRQTLTHLP
jgi:hypothetical protein